MIKMGEDYNAAISADSRRTLLKAVIEIIDPDIILGSATSSGAEEFSKPEQLTDKVMEMSNKYVTLEPNRWLLGRGYKLIPEDNNIPGQVGMVNKAISGADGTFSTPQWVEQPFSNVSILQACSVFFPDSDVDGVAEDFTVEIYQGGVAYHTEKYTGNLESSVSLSGFTVYDPDAIRVTATKWSIPGRKMRTAEIIPGIYEEWDGKVVAALEIKHQGDVSCLSLPYGTCTLRINNKDRRFEPRSKSGIFQSIDERQGIDIYIGVRTQSGDEYVHVGKFYQYSGGWRTSDNGITIQWNLVDIMGLLADRQFIPPETLPTTLGGWAEVLVSQLGVNFADMWTVDENYKNVSLTVTVDDLAGKTCGEIIRWVCMASGTWPRADAQTGKLTFEPLWSEGNKIVLRTLEQYPVMRANNDIAAIIFTLNDGNDTKYVVSGNATASSQTVSVSNPFIKTQAQALTAARLILSAYGGNKLETTGRGDPASEIGDVDTVWLDESSATTGRRIMQTFGFQGGVLRGCKSTLLQADGSFLYENRVVITKSGSWTAPTGVNSLRVILVGKGGDGTDGMDGTWNEAGENGAPGVGGLVWAGTIDINDGQNFVVSISGTGTTFGAYSSQNGQHYPYGYTDVVSGDSFARTGVSAPLAGSGDGGIGGKGGRKGNRHTETAMEDNGPGSLPTTVTVVDNRPGKGTAGVAGATGCVVIYWDKEAEA